MKMMSNSNLSTTTIYLGYISVLEHPESEEEIGSDDLAESSGDKSEETKSEGDEVLEEEEQSAWS